MRTESADGDLEDRSDDDGALHFPHSHLPQFRLILVGHVGEDLRFRALPFGQTEDGERRHQEGERAALYDGQADADGALEQSYDARHEYDGGDDGAAHGVVLLDAQGRRQDEGHGNGPSEHHQVMLHSIPEIYADVEILKGVRPRGE